MSNTYMRLYEYYQKMFSLVDSICFNSSNTKSIYSGYMQLPANNRVIPVIHSDISDNRISRIVDAENLRFGFIGNETPYKGFPLLKEVLIDMFNVDIRNWTLSVWGGSKKKCPDCERIVFRGKYTSDQLKIVFDQMDLLIVPSVWNETFSLITLEALSYGVPVLVSATVGAKDIVAEYDKNFIFGGRDDLKSILNHLCNNIQPLHDYNQKILEKEWLYSHEAHVEAIRNWYESVMEHNKK